MRLPAVLSILVVLLVAPARGDARCACLCVDGALGTVCNDAQDVRRQLELCAARAGQTCPPPPEAPAARQRYAAPVEDVANCRDAGIYDPSTNGYLTASVCDAVSDEGADAGPGQGADP